MGRPAHAQENSTIDLFKLDADVQGATRVKVKLGMSSIDAIQIIDGLKEGDRVILSDISEYDGVDRLTIK